MVALLSSYLFEQQTHLNDLWTRKGDETMQFWTLPYVPGKRLPSIPVYVLTSQRTFSGAEEFTNNLKVLKRATIVGEVTGGGAHPVGGHRIDDRFTIGVPFARAINPVTKTNWEGVGVEPDVKVAADDALTTAQALAAKEIASRRAAKPSRNTRDICNFMEACRRNEGRGHKVTNLCGSQCSSTCFDPGHRRRSRYFAKSSRDCQATE